MGRPVEGRELSDQVHRRRPLATLLAIMLLLPAAVLLETATRSAEAAYEGQFVWPMSGTVTSIHWECRSDCTRYHRGIDIANGCDTSIYAAREGVVSLVGWDADGYGNYVIIDHAEGYLTLYGHMARVDVSDGQSVTTSTRLGIEGTTGASTGCHVHFEVRQDDEGASVDTKQFVPARDGEHLTRGAAIPYDDRLVSVQTTQTVRDGPGMTLVSGQGNVAIGTAQAGETYVSYARWDNAGTSWLAISFNGRVGWLRASAVQDIGGTALRVSADGALNVRSAAGTENGVIGRVHGGQAYLRLDSASDSAGATWYEIYYDGSAGAGRGWVHGGYTRSETFGTPPTGSLAGKKIAVDAGHGGSDPGAQGFGDDEKAVTLAIAQRVQALLEADGASVLMTRTSDATVSLSARTDAANAWGADRFLSIHANACGSCGATGTETYYHDSLSASSTAADWAGETQPRVVSEVGTRDRGVKQANFHVLRETAMPAILVETAFIDTQSDHDLLVSPAAQDAFAHALLYGVQAHFGITPHDPTTGGGGAAWSEGFESGLATGWTYSQSGGPAAWHVHEGFAASGTHSLALHDYGADENDDAITPTLSLASMTAPTLRFSSWMAGERACLLLGLLCTTYDAGSLAISDDGGNTWTQLMSDHWQTSGWQTYAFDLSDFAGDSVLVRWHFESDSSQHNAGWYVDDVRVSDDA